MQTVGSNASISVCVLNTTDRIEERIERKAYNLFKGDDNTYNTYESRKCLFFSTQKKLLFSHRIYILVPKQ